LADFRKAQKPPTSFDLLYNNWYDSCSLRWAMDGRIVRCGIISWCRSVATCEIVQRFWATVKSAKASVGLYLCLTFNVLFNTLQASVKLTLSLDKNLFHGRRLSVV